MTKLRIGIDVDGVLRDFVEQIAVLAHKETGIRPATPTSYYYDIENETGISFRKRIWETKEWLVPVFEDAPVIENAKEAFKKFVDNDRYNVYIVSAQEKGTEQHTTNWLEKNGFTGFQDIIYTKKKLDAPCQILIDDKISNIKEYDSNSRMGILQDTTYNQDYKTNRRVKNLIEAYNLLENKYGRS